MRRSQKTRWTNFLKRGREWHRSCRPFPVRAMAVCFYLCVCVCLRVFVGVCWLCCVPCASIRAYRVLRWLYPTQLIWTLNTMNRHVYVFDVKFANSDRFIMFNTNAFNRRPICSNRCLLLNVHCKNHTLAEISRYFLSIGRSLPSETV